MRDNYLKQLNDLQNKLLDMGKMAECAIERTKDSMVFKDYHLANLNIEKDKEIDYQMKEIEKLCLKILMRQQPVAKDLRLISSILKMVSDLERIGDNAAKISEIFLSLPDTYDIQKFLEINIMCSKLQEMLTFTLEAFVSQNTNDAKIVCNKDKEINELFENFKKKLVSMLEINNLDYEIDLFMIAKYLERIGDHIVNVAKWIIFLHTGIRNGCNYMSEE